MSSRHSLYCFCGPTISGEAVREIIPGAQTLPPAGHGDLFQLPLASGDVVLIIDGYYFDRFPMRHREILEALNQGVTVVGASSIGALRAVELEPFGMIGRGKIFRMFRRGTLVGDDEVAVLHASEEFGFAPQSEALVNIRATCRAACRLQILSPREADLVLNIARERGFWERNYAAILKDAVAAGLLPASARRFESKLPDIRCDLKRADALDTLNWLAAAGRVEGRPPRLAQGGPTVHFHRWQQESQTSRVNSTYIRDVAVLEAAQVLAADYPTLHYRVALECIAAGALSPENREVGAPSLERFLAGLGVEASSLPAFLVAKSLRLEELEAEVRRRGRIAALLGSEDEAALSELEELAVEVAEREGMLKGVSDRLIAQGWLSRDELQAYTPVQQRARILSRAVQLGFTTPLRGPFVTTLKLYGDYAAAARRAQAAEELNTQHSQRRPDLSLAQLSSVVVGDWFLQRWARTNIFRACADRGLPNEQIAYPVLRRLYLYDRTHVADPPWSVCKAVQGHGTAPDGAVSVEAVRSP